MEDKFMKEALKEAKKAYEKLEIPVGAIIVKDGKIHNSAELMQKLKNNFPSLMRDFKIADRYFLFSIIEALFPDEFSLHRPFFAKKGIVIENQKERIFNMIDSEHYIFRDGGNFFVQANFNPQYKEQAIELVKAEIEKIKTTVSEDEIKKAKKKIKSRFASNAETVSEIGENIGYYMTVCDDLALVSDYLPILESITVDDVQNASKEYLNINNAVISVLLPE